MKTAKSSSKPSHYELLLQSYDKAITAYERAKIEVKNAKQYLKSASKNISKTDLEILELEVKRSKFRRKSRKIAVKITNIRLKQRAKSHEEEVKIYQLSETGLVEKNLKKDKKEPKINAENATKPEPIAEVKKAVVKTLKSSKPAPEPKPQETKTEKPARKPRRSSAEVQAEKAAKKAISNGDDFTIVEGIGEKTRETLHNAGIKTFKQLAASDFETLKGIMRAAKNKLAVPTTWAEQAQLVLNNDIAGLKTLQESLKGGKRV